MNRSIRDRLIDIGVEPLADLLLTLAQHNSDVIYGIRRLLATSEELAASFRKTLALLIDPEELYSRQMPPDPDGFLSRLYEDLKSETLDPQTGFALVTELFQSGTEIIDLYDDIDHSIESFFSTEFSELFHHFAQHIDDKTKVIDTILTLIADDDYQLCSSLIDSCSLSLDESSMRILANVFLDKPEGEVLFSEREMILSLARQLNDIELYEQHAMVGIHERRGQLDLALMHCNRGEYQRALDRLNTLDRRHDEECKNLLVKVYRALGDKDQVLALLKEHFLLYKNKVHLEAYEAEAGTEAAALLLEESIVAIEEGSTYNPYDLQFLMEMQKFSAAEQYILTHRSHINGTAYYLWNPIADQLYKNRNYLGATVLYRALLISILERGYSRAYHWGITYLRALDEMESSIATESDLETHANFKEKLHDRHGRKWSFWKQYNNA